MFLLNFTNFLSVLVAILTTLNSVIKQEGKYEIRVADCNSLITDSGPYAISSIKTGIPSLLSARACTDSCPNLFVGKRKHLRYISYLLILRASDTQLNPGPPKTTPDFPCGACGTTCDDWSQNCICCDDCETWYHANCIPMRDEVFLPYTLEGNNDHFTCLSCGVPNFASSLFESMYSADENISIPTINSLHSIHHSDLSDPESVSSCAISNLSSISKSSCSISSDMLRPSCSSPVPSKKPRHKMKTNNIRLTSVNIQSVASSKKRASFWNFIDSVNCDILCGCETWLNPSICDAEILPPNSEYNVHRKDRHDGYGGSLILVRNNIHSERVEIDTPCDIVFVKIDCINNETLIVGSAYRPTNNDEEYATHLYNTVSSICSQFKKATIWITGDFNLPDICWKNNSINGHQYRKSVNELFLRFETDLGLTQAIDFPTRCNNILDLFFTNRPELINRSSPMPGISDHHAVFVDTDMSAPRRKPAKRTLYMWGKANMEAIKAKCKAVSDSLIDLTSNSSDIDTIWEHFKSSCQMIVNDEVPSRQSGQRFNQPWANREVRRTTRLKHRWFRRAKKTNSKADWDKYKSIKRQSQRACRLAHDSHVSDILETDNGKMFWNYIKSRKKDNFGVSPLKKDGITYSSAERKADILNDQFTSVFSKEDSSSKPSLPHSQVPSARPITIREKGVLKLLQGLKPHKAAGPDQISTRLLKHAAFELTPGLTRFFQLSIDQGKIPTDWKSAIVSPIFKKGNRSTPSNYRPISLTSVTCKILEHIIFSHIMSHFDANNILTDYQHGFRKKRSCDTQLLLTINDLAKGIDKNQQIDGILLDFSKAFDKVSHSRLLQKLHHYGVRNSIHSWIKDFLQCRTQQVVLDGASSTASAVTSGVPQGSVLGPLLFLAYINDLPSRVKSTVRLFADDCLMYRTIKSEKDARQLQEDLNSLQEWENEWLMSFNPDKCEVIHVTNKRNPIKFTYNIHGTALKPTDSAKYLGVTITPNLSWKPHIDNITKKANSTMSFLRRNISACPPTMKETAYKTYVRPTIEYASSVWSPHTTSHINQLEMVQRRAARFVKRDYRRTSSVTSMLQDLKWDTLQHRRNITRVTMLYKILNGLVDVTPNPPLRPSRSTRYHSQQIIQLPCHKSTYQHSFFPASVVLWNRLPQQAASQPSLEGFKAAVDDIHTL